MSTPEFATTDALRKRQLGIFIGVAVLVIGGLSAFLYHNAQQQARMPGQARERVVSQDFDTPGQVVDPADAWITKSEVSLAAMAKRMAEYEKENALLRNRIERLAEGAVVAQESHRRTTPDTEEHSAEALLPPLPEPPPPRTSLPPPEATPAPERIATNRPSPMSPPPAIVRIAFTQVGGQADDAALPHINETLPAGTFVNAVMLNGLAAPTGNLGQRNPHPILMELVDFGNLPNRFAHRVKACRIIAAGHGELSDERAYLRLERLSCVLRTGEVISKEARGYVSGEDGKNGLAGVLVTKQGAFVARALLAGIFSGLGDAIGRSYANISTSALGTVESIDPGDIGKAGLAEGVSNAAEKVADWYLARADEVFPFVEIEAGRIVTVTFTEDIDLGANLLDKHVP